MTRPFKITNDRIARMNEKYRAAQMLGFNNPANRRSSCMYEYPDGCRCGIGAALSPAMIKRVKDLNLNSGADPRRLQNEGICTFENVEVAVLTQHFHDAIANGINTTVKGRLNTAGYHPDHLLPKKIKAFLDREADTTIGGDLYTRWINLLKQETHA